MENKHLKYLKIIIMLIVLSLITTTVTFVFSNANLDKEMFSSYFNDMRIVVMNLLPILLFMSISYLITNRMWLSFLISNIIFVTASLVNKFKLTYRDDPFTFMDIKLFSESMAMTKRYDIYFTWRIVSILIGLILISILLKIFFKYRLNSTKKRVSTMLIVLIITAPKFKNLYFDKEIYKELGDKSLINIWSEQQQFRSKGFVYPFIHSISEAREYVLEGYDEENAINDLKKYEYKNIADDRKVNIVGIMLEAYNDFSKFENIEIDEEVYANFHNIKSASVHGELVTNVFAGGTINTERGFLTGFHNHPNYIRNTNSFVWYLKEQGYNTKAMHPIYGWFYNRRSVNEFLGFDSFDYYENKYIDEQEGFFADFDFFDFIIEDYEKSIAENKPYFNFTVTYQNHGPYSDEKIDDKEYLKRKPEYNESDYNIINNYLRGISDTDKAIKKLVDYFESRDEPTILVLFGDHNPWLGENSTGYEMLGIDIDLSNEEGFKNYYKTPYIIWGNSNAKEIIGKNFDERSEDISPNFLMAEIFEYLGYEGNEYMQYLTQLKKNIDVNHEVYFKENGKYTNDLNEENQKRYEEFKNLEYYYERNFKENKK